MMDIRFTVWLHIVLLLGCGISALNVPVDSKQCSDNSGTEFLVAFLENSRTGVPLQLYLLTPLQYSVKVSVTTPTWSSSQAVDQTVYVNPQTTTIVGLPYELMLSGTGIEQKVVRVVAEDYIVVYAGNIQKNTADMYLVYPTKYLGHHYLVPKIHTGEITAAVVALHDDTFVEVRSDGNVTTNGTEFSSNLSTMLNSYDILNVKSFDGNHVIVTANDSISVIAGHKFLPVDTLGGNSADHIVEQILHVQLCSKEYVVVSSYIEPGFGEHVKIYGVHENTRIMITNSSTSFTVTLSSSGDSYSFFMYKDEPVLLQGDRDFAVFQYGVASSNSNNYYSDAYLYQVSGTNQYVKSVVFPNPPPPSNDINIEGRLVVVANKDALSSIYLNGEVLNASWSQVGVTEYYFAHISLNETFNTLVTNFANGKMSGFISSTQRVLQSVASIGKYLGSPVSETDDTYSSAEGDITVKFRELLTDLIPTDNAILSENLPILRCFSRCVKLPGCMYVEFNENISPSCKLYDLRVSCDFRQFGNGSNLYSRL